VPKYLIHIGPHKTGTTALQSGFKRHRDDLFDRGILYPEQWYLSADNSTHLPLVQELQHREKALEQEFNKLNNSNYSHILISSEDLVDLPLDSIVYFKHIIGDSPVNIIFYCRNWSSLIQSGSQESIKQGHAISLPEFFANAVLGAWESRIINFSVVLDKYSKAFNISNLKLVSYDEVVASKVGLLQHFFQTFADWNSYGTADDPILNASLSPNEIETIRVLNMIEWALNRHRGIELRDRFLSRKRTLDLGVIEESMKRHLAGLDIDESSPALGELHRHIFEAFGSRMVDPKPPSGLFRPLSKRISYVSDGYLFEEGVFKAFQELYEKLRG
jgi:hypothetical protein